MKLCLATAGSVCFFIFEKNAWKEMEKKGKTHGFLTQRHPQTSRNTLTLWHQPGLYIHDRDIYIMCTNNAELLMFWVVPYMWESCFCICGGYWLSVEYCMRYRYGELPLTWGEITHTLYLWNIFGIKSTVKVCCFSKCCMGGSIPLSCLYGEYDAGVSSQFASIALTSLTLQKKKKKSNVNELF